MRHQWTLSLPALYAGFVVVACLMGQAPSPHASFDLYSRGSGMSESAADARYLKLDASNDPLTGSLDVEGDLWAYDAALTTPRVSGVAGGFYSYWDESYSSTVAASFSANVTSGPSPIVALAQAYPSTFPAAGACYSSTDSGGGAELALSGVSAGDARVCAGSTNGLRFGLVTSLSGATWQELWRLESTAATTTVPVVHPDGSSGAPSIRFGDADTGIFRDSATNQIGVTSNATPAVLFEAGGHVFYESDGTTKALEVSDSYMWISNEVRAVPGSTHALGTVSYPWASVTVAAGSSSAAAIQIGNVDDGIYQSVAHALDIVIDGANAARFAGEFETQMLLDTSGSASTPSVAAITDGNTGLALFGSGSVQLVSDGVAHAAVDNTGMHGPAYTSGTGTGWQAPRLTGATLPTKPACTGASNGGTFAYFDDTDDALPAAFCVCAAGSGGTYAWRLPDAVGTACPL